MSLMTINNLPYETTSESEAAPAIVERLRKAFDEVRRYEKEPAVIYLGRKERTAFLNVLRKEGTVLDVGVRGMQFQGVPIFELDAPTYFLVVGA